MLLRLGKQTKGTDAPETPREAAPDLTAADFIPFTYHYDPHTLLTKNGELVQILRVTTSGSGVDYESPEPGMPALRDTIREALSAIDSDRYAYWFHTLRRRIPITHQPAFPEGFAADLHTVWQEKCNWRYSFINEVYISVLRQGQSSELFDFKEMTKTLIPIRNRRYRENFTDKAREELEANVSRVIEVLSKNSNVRRLTIVERPTGSGTIGVYSEPMEFLHYLINLQPAAMPIRNIDASRQLSTHDITFGFDVAESRSDSGKRRFAGMLTWKGTLDLSPEVLDKCLQLPQEMIISQTFNYLPAKQALEKRLAAKDLLDGNPDPFVAKASGLTTMVESDKGRPTDFGEQHTSIAIIRDQYKRLDEAIGGVQESFAKLGLVSVREEIRLEDCFWAQLPGNFPFLSRKAPAASSRIGGLARLNHFPSGRSAGNHWGAPLAIIPTTLGTPYFFNFHHDDVGHTAILDFNSFADERGTMLLNFLLTCSRQYGGRMVVLDRNHSAKPLIKALRGRYYHPLEETDTESAACRFNPLQLPDTPRNRSFLAAWLSHFVKPDLAQQDSTRAVLKEALDALFTLPEEQRSLAAALERIAARDDSLLAPLNPLLDKLFGAAADSADLTRPICAVEMLDVTKHRELIVPLFSYLLHRIVTSLDGKPTIIVLNEAWDLLDNPFFLPRISSLLDMLRQNNAMMIFTTRHFEDYLESPLTPQIMENTPTKLFVPDDIATNYFPEVTGLTERETKRLLRMERQKGLFLIKHGKQVVECLFQDNKLGMLSKTLAGDSKALRLMQIQQR